MAASKASFASKCHEAECACEKYMPQYYRPALCKQCFHDISQHFPGQYVSELDKSGNMFFIHNSTGHRLFAQPSHATEAVTDKGISGAIGDAELSASGAGAVITSTKAPIATMEYTAKHEEEYMMQVEKIIGEAPASVPLSTLSTLGFDMSTLRRRIDKDTKEITAEADSKIATKADELQQSEASPVPNSSVEVAKTEAAVTETAVSGLTTADEIKPSASEVAVRDPAGDEAEHVDDGEPPKYHPMLVALLGPLESSPLLINVQELVELSAQVPWVKIYYVNQPLEEDYYVSRHILVSPFTIMAIAAHPTRLGWGFVKWERCLLSLRDISIQHSEATTPQKSKSFLPFFRSKSHPVAAAATTGVLLSFSQESPQSMTFLRTYRAGCRPCRLEGFLLKRKRSAWRQSAPLGPLGWKSRYFVLNANKLTYYTAPPSSGGKLKGEIVLTGWIDVSPLGVEFGSEPGDVTTKPHCFKLRTNKTYHIFQAASKEDCDAWVAALHTNSQHACAATDAPQLLLSEDTEEIHHLIHTLVKNHSDFAASIAIEVPELNLDPHMLALVSDADVDGILAIPDTNDYVAAMPEDAAAAASADEEPCLWQYQDENGSESAPLAADEMLSLFESGVLDNATMILPVSFTETFTARVYVTIEELFPARDNLFGPKSSWLPRYAKLSEYSELQETASNMGLDSAAVKNAVIYMRQHDMPPDVSLLLDLVGVAEARA